MREVRIGRHRVSIFESIDELPMVRFHKYNKMLLVDAGLGSDLTSLDAHFEKVVRFMRNGDSDNAAKEMENLRQNIFVVQSELSPRHLAFACLVAAIDGKPCDDLTDEGIEGTRQRLNDASARDIATAFAEAKKKIDSALTEYFPALFSSSEEKEYYDNMKRLAVTQLESITKGASQRLTERVRELTDRLVLAVKPRAFVGKDAFGVQHDKNYERMCLAISSNLNVNAKVMTVLEYYTASEYLSDVLKERQKRAYKAKTLGTR